MSANVVCDLPNRPKILDFGLAAPLPHAMPEQVDPHSSVDGKRQCRGNGRHIWRPKLCAAWPLRTVGSLVAGRAVVRDAAGERPFTGSGPYEIARGDSRAYACAAAGLCSRAARSHRPPSPREGSRGAIRTGCEVKAVLESLLQDERSSASHTAGVKRGPWIAAGRGSRCCPPSV
jgi:hypothetical protein